MTEGSGSTAVTISKEPHSWRDRLSIAAIASVILAAFVFIGAVVFVGIRFDQQAASDSRNSDASRHAAVASHHATVSAAAAAQTLRNDAVYLYERLNQICAKVDCGPPPPLPKQVKVK